MVFSLDSRQSSWNLMMRLNWEKNSNHLAWWWERILVVKKYYKFLWFVIISMRCSNPLSDMVYIRRWMSVGLTQKCYHMQVHLSGNNVPAVKPSPNHTSPPFLQHISWQCCNHLGILSSMVEILLFNSVFHDGVTPVSVLTLKPPLRVIGVLPLKPWVSPNYQFVYKTSSYIVIC